MRMIMTAVKWRTVAYCSLFAFLFIAGCSDEEESYPNCPQPASELEGLMCESDEQIFCRQVPHPCCENFICGCNSTSRDEDSPRAWSCRHSGCADDAEACSGVCDVDPYTPGCPPLEDADRGSGQKNSSDGSVDSPGIQP